jgi:hypothetical protein
MRAPVLVSLVVLTIGFGALHPARAEEPHAVDAATLRAAVAGAADAEEADRAALRALLARPDVQAAARGAGLDLERAGAAVSTLHGEELQRLAGQARALDDTSLGGATTIVITSTALLIALILVLLLA